MLTTHNVVGAFSSNKGKDFAAVLEEIIKIVEPEAPGIEVPEKGWPTWGGYHDEVGGRWSVVWRTHDAQYWGKTIRDSRTGDVLRMGTPQRRRRISVVADLGGDTAAQIQFDRESVSGHPAESGAAGERPAGAAESGASYAVRIRGGCDGGGKGALVQTERSGTLGTGNDQTIFAPTPINLMVATRCKALGRGTGFGVGEPGDPANTISAAHSHGVFATAIPINDKATRWQGGGESRNHDGSGNGLGIGKEGDPSPTLTAGDRHGVMCGNQVPLTYQDVTGTLSPGAHAGSYNGQDAYNDMLVCGVTPDAARAILYQPKSAMEENWAESETKNALRAGESKVSHAVVCEDVSHTIRAKANCAYREDAETYPVQNMVVRRLTPMECERLQGFPDHWTDIGEWTDEKGKKHKDADSPRYKALGNSIALPFWDWMLRRMARYLPEGATLGSLFDGISGFNVCWARIHGAECCRWSSEIEQFPIAVAKKHFGDEKSGETGDWEIFSGGMTW